MHNIVDTIKIIEYLKVLQHISDHRGSIIRDPCTANYTHVQRVRICCHNTDHVHVNGHDRTVLLIFSQVLYKAP